MPRDFRRSDRVAGSLRRELAQIIQQEVRDPDIGFISLSDVEVSRDLAHAELHFHHDASVETGRHMDELIENAVSSDRSTDAEDDPGQD